MSTDRQRAEFNEQTHEKPRTGGNYYLVRVARTLYNMGSRSMEHRT